MTFLLYVLGLFAVNVITPGASFILTMKIAMDSGRKAGVALGLGLVTADLVYASAALLGLAALLQRNASVASMVAFLGGAWIAHMGLKLFLGPRKDASALVELETKKVTPFAAYRTGAIAGLANPQAIIFFTSVFVGAMVGKPSQGHTLLLLAGIGLVSAIIRCSLVALASADKIRETFLFHKRKVERVSGGLLLFFGVKLTGKAALVLAEKIVGFFSIR